MKRDLSIIVPVLNEAANIPILIDRISAALSDLEWEVVFVDDDSSDASRNVLIDLSQINDRVRFITRIGRQGLSTAVIEGALTSHADCIAVMDGDLQHDETLLPEMFKSLRENDADIVVGSRFLESSSLGEFSAQRERMSRIGNWLSNTVIKTQLTDPLSGFFMISRKRFESVVRELSGTGFKILLDVLSSSNTPMRVKELPFKFGTRIHGESKIDSLVALEFGMMLLDKWFGRWIPPRFFLFTAVGGLGVGIHVAILGLLFKLLDIDFYIAQVVATLVTMAINFSLNNILTYRDRRLHGLGFIKGLLSFYVVCSIGALANFQFAEFLFNKQAHWILAGLGGAVIGAVWNYAMTSIFTWKKK